MPSEHLTPEEIRAIRTRLGLTQAEAGADIGGGPHAFTKYENGSVAPSAGVINLLRLLDAHPEAVRTLNPLRALPPSTARLSPFEVTGGHIAGLNEQELPQLLRRLLHAEAREHSIPASGIHVASNITASDGGEDGRIAWRGAPERTDFLPSQLSQFQTKAGRISPAAAGNDVLTKSREVKEMVRSALEAGGHYVMLCASPYTQKQIVDREDRIRKALRDAGLKVADEQIHVRDADQIAAWVNKFPAVSVWVKEAAAPETVGPFRSWSHWASRAEHDQSAWVDDERLPDLRARLLEQTTQPQRAIRMVGRPGIGKSRLVLEALRPATNAAEHSPSDIVLYATPSEVGEETIKRAVQNLVDSGQRAIVVVDDCDPAAAGVLTEMISRSDSGLSLVTIDSEIPPGTLERSTIEVDEAPDSVIEAVVSRLLPRGVPFEDHRRIERFSKGFPAIAIRVVQAWDASTPVAHAPDETLIETFVLGRSNQDRDAVLKSATLLATFGMVRVERPIEGCLNEVASFGRNLSDDDFYEACIALADRGVAKRRGRAVVLQAGPIAMRLAEQRWGTWRPDRWDGVLAGHMSPQLKIQAARRLALLDTTEIAPKVVAHVCREGGPFDGVNEASRPGHAEVLSSLAEVSPEVVAGLIERILDDAGDQLVDEDLRRHLARALEKISFHADTFEEGALLLLRLAVAESGENQLRSSNTAERFEELFPMILGGTAADGDARIAALDRASDTDDPAQLIVVAEALSAGARTRGFQRSLGAESQGSRPALQSWLPATRTERADYVSACVGRLGGIAERRDEAGKIARANLSNQLGRLIRVGFVELEVVESVVSRVAAAVDYWPQAAANMAELLSHNMDELDQATTDRIRTLVIELQPKSLDARVESGITRVRWDYRGESIEARDQRATAAVRELAAELFAQRDILESYLPRLSCGDQQMGRAFGEAIADLAGGAPYWLQRFVQAVTEVREDKRGFDLLSGYVAWLAKNRPDTAEAFKRRAAQSRELAPALPQLCITSGLARSDIQLAIGSLQSGLLPPSRLSYWISGSALMELPASTVAPLFDAMLDHGPEAFATAVDLMAMHGLEKLKGFRTQVVKVAENAARWPPSTQTDAGRFEYEFEEILTWMLAKGRSDRDASTAALALAKAMLSTQSLGAALPIGPLVPTLLSSFPEVVWPLIGQAIVSDPRKARSAAMMLGDIFSSGAKTSPAILDLPENTLFAWCHAHPDRAPAFVARVVPVLTTVDVDGSDPSLHPVMSRLLDEFGDCDDVLSAVDDNIHTFSWEGSLVTYYRQYEEPLRELCRHRRPKVSRWSRSMLRRLDTLLTEARNEDEERQARWAV